MSLGHWPPPLLPPPPTVRPCCTIFIYFNVIPTPSLSLKIFFSLLSTGKIPCSRVCCTTTNDRGRVGQIPKLSHFNSVLHNCTNHICLALSLTAGSYAPLLYGLREEDVQCQRIVGRQGHGMLSLQIYPCLLLSLFH